MKYLILISFLLLFGCNIINSGTTELGEPELIRLYAGKPRAKINVASITQTSSYCTYHFGDATVNYSAYLLNNKESKYYNSKDIYDALPGKHPFLIEIHEEVSEWVMPDINPFDPMAVSSASNDIISLKSSNIPIALTLKPGHIYRLLLEKNNEDNESCNLCIEETPRDKHQIPENSSSKNIHCQLIKYRQSSF